jgi:hypothetical protein
MLNAIQGGFAIEQSDWNLIREQRAITRTVNNNFIQVGAVFLKASSKNPFAADWWAKNYRDTDLQGWIDDANARLLNVGFNLQFGWIDIDIDSSDPVYNSCIVEAMKAVGVDTRFAFGRQSVGVPSHLLVQLSEEESTNFEELKKFEPNDFSFGGNRFKTELRSFATNTDMKNLVREAKQTVMPGSIYANKKDASKHDISVWYEPNGVAHNIADIATTTPRRTTFNTIIRAIAFGTTLYLLRPHWVEGTRQQTAQRVSGWLARVVAESQSMNNHEALSEDVFCPIDSDDIAESLLEFICKGSNDDESHMRVRTFRDARKKVERNPDAKIPGWPTMSHIFGDAVVNALRAVLMPGADISILTQMADRYVYDETDDKYIDRTRFQSPIAFTHDGTELDRRHRGDFVRAGGKLRPAFKLFEISTLRKRVSTRDLYPELNPGGIFRINRASEQVGDEDDGEPGTITVFNTWRGWPVAIAQPVDGGVLNTCVTMLDRLLAYLTRDNKEQAEWLKQWVAWTFQHPAVKQQVSPVIIGGQGVGKSFFGNTFIPALMQTLWGTASPKILEGTFAIEPFVGKMCVFIDEAKFHSESSTDEIKKLIRNVNVGGAEKYQNARNYRIFARVIFASNKFDINIGQANVQDRALFYIKAYDKDHLLMDASEFRNWAVTLKPFFDEFDALLKRRDIREHFMYYFSTLPVDRHYLENTNLSSSADNDVVSSNMSWPRRIAKYIIEDGRIYEDGDISMPFTAADLNKRVVEVCKELGMSNVHGQRVLAEFKEAGLLEPYTENGRNYLRFKWHIGTLTENYGSSISVVLEPRFQFTDEDRGLNTSTLKNPRHWKGLNARMFGKI